MVAPVESCIAKEMVSLQKPIIIFDRIEGASLKSCKVEVNKADFREKALYAFLHFGVSLQR